MRLRRLACIVSELVFDRSACGGTAVRYAIEDTAVAERSDFPLEPKVEVAVVPVGCQTAGAALDVQNRPRDLPCTGGLVTRQCDPALERASVEERLEAGFDRLADARDSEQGDG